MESLWSKPELGFLAQIYHPPQVIVTPVTTHCPSRIEAPQLSALLWSLSISAGKHNSPSKRLQNFLLQCQVSQDHMSCWCMEKCLCSFERVTLCDLVFVRVAQLRCSAGHNLFVESLHSLNTKKLKEQKFCIIYSLTSPKPIVYFGGLPMPQADRSLEPLITFFSSAQPVINIFLFLLSLLLCSNKVLVLQW